MKPSHLSRNIVTDRGILMDFAVVMNIMGLWIPISMGTLTWENLSLLVTDSTWEDIGFYRKFV